MPDRETPYKLELDEETREQLEIALCVRVTEAVTAAADRNSQLRIWRDQLEGFGVTAQNQQWANACDLTDPLSMEAFLTISSQLVGAMHRDPKVAVEAFSKDDEDSARVLESWLSMVGAQSQVDGRIYDLAYNACVDPAVVGYVGWSQKTRTKREVGYKGKDGRVVSEEAREDTEEYEEVPVGEEVIEESYDIRAVDLCDFYLFPATVESVDDATAVMERMYLTAEALWDGVRDFGYNKEAVEELTAMGPSGSVSDDRQAMADIDGLQEEQGPSGIYEVYTCYTRLPRQLPGGQEDMPEHLLQDDFLVVCVPDRQIVLKIAFSPFLERPYFVGGIMPKPRRVQGHGLMGVLEGLQSEANATIQQAIDSTNIIMSPAVLAHESDQESLGKATFGPGAVIYVKDPSAILPWPINTNPTRDGLTWLGDIRARAKAIVSAEGQGQLQNKVRKAAEVQAVETASSAKFGMYLSNFQRTVVSELFRRIISLKLQFGDVDEDGEDFVDAAGHSHKLTARALRGKYSIVATGTSLTHSPEARVQVNTQKAAIQTGYVGAMVQGMPPKFLKLLWHGAREQLFDLGDRNPESWIGEEPEDPPPDAPVAAPGGPQGGQPGQNGTGQSPQQQSQSLQGLLGANN